MMKTILKTTMMLLLLVSTCVYGQFGIGTNTPDNSAILELHSTTKGFLLPRMTIDQRNAIDTPLKGSLVFCTDCTPPGLSLFTTLWETLDVAGASTTLAIERCEINGTFVQGEESITRYLTVTYKQASITSIGTLDFSTDDVVLSGLGSPGLVVGTPSPSSYTFTGINDTVDVLYPISGTPQNLGVVNSTVDYLSMVTFSTTTSVDSGTVTLDLSNTIEIPSVAANLGTIDDVNNKQTYNIPYSGGIGLSNITFSEPSDGGSNFSIPDTSINEASGSITVTISATPSYTVPAGPAELFTIDVFVNDTNVGSISVNSIDVIPMSNGAGGTMLFATHNLGADTSLDPNIPVQGIHGDYYQWGRENPSSANAYSGSAPISGWSYSNYVPADWWKEDGGGFNEPCPDGFRVPTQNEMSALRSHNQTSYTGNWYTDNDDYGNAVHFKYGNNTLTLPAAGTRGKSTGEQALLKNTGWYWTSTAVGNNSQMNSVVLDFGQGYVVNPRQLNKNTGLSVRCIKK